jgi:uncharacterized protein
MKRNILILITTAFVLALSAGVLFGLNQRAFAQDPTATPGTPTVPAVTPVDPTPEEAPVTPEATVIPPEVTPATPTTTPNATPTMPVTTQETPAATPPTPSPTPAPPPQVGPITIIPITGAARTITVTGTGSIAAAPDQITVRIGVRTEGTEATDTMEQNNQQMNSLLNALRQSGIPARDIRTEGITLRPRFVDRPTPEQPAETQGFIATNIVQVRVRELEQLGELLDAAIQAGGNLIESINFELSEPQQWHDQALEIAMNDARRKAEQLAGLAGTQLGAVWSISETDRFPIAARGVAEMADVAAVPVEPGLLSVQVQLEVTWLLD